MPQIGHECFYKIMNSSTSLLLIHNLSRMPFQKGDECMFFVVILMSCILNIAAFGVVSLLQEHTTTLYTRGVKRCNQSPVLRNDTCLVMTAFGQCQGILIEARLPHGHHIITHCIIVFLLYSFVPSYPSILLPVSQIEVAQQSLI